MTEAARSRDRQSPGSRSSRRRTASRTPTGSGWPRIETADLVHEERVAAGPAVHLNGVGHQSDSGQQLCDVLDTESAQGIVVARLDSSTNSGASDGSTSSSR
jgi:hypothetical protein